MIDTNARRAFDARRRQVIELLDLGKGDVDLRRGRSRGARESAAGSRCSVCGPNTTSTYGARRTIAAPSCDATQPPTPMTRSGFCGLQRAHAAEVVEHALLRLLAHRAGVEQDDVGVIGPIGQREPVGWRRARRPCGPSRTRSSGSRTCGCRACPPLPRQAVEWARIIAGAARGRPAAAAGRCLPPFERCEAASSSVASRARAASRGARRAKSGVQFRSAGVGRESVAVE